ncbi:D-fructose 1,6-bisphosphatase [Haloarcula quadrata]|jgi:fructose-1,6-bisphosphatase I|uniref:Fructose-1,6-bisphosphatase class 1 1 n=5 Tax=Haloarcula TaxID=2237 RepID=F16A1_HALMA|nr:MULTISPECIES: class 1 fructose-bisphosphatase [Haloarcula]Q5V3Z1.1 RecName: Full=Fructose-1,6-bisphosphatase class 1 1; Short=FBPase class 1 1; AltName: Full=D-fructose-1,6-bisphosphate 1-phosphohydrolase class 1 1 [Haloarcula marismortui ATCC 43049]AAV45761.1 fructose-16-bisphosphatase [Haloarcula marismortui ATCC 43049]EMA13643.1 fructose-1,6-bisphosphatase [Haloarcula sinaiiensis ATCC 33800]EMA26160.1 fructose-1,6-bisphosphatase [Haloarcula californiae ATCC 33799]NHX38413.1 class 1 fruct
MSKSLDISTTEAEQTVTEVIDTIVATTPDVRRAVADYRGQSNSVNPTGDDQLAADLRADELFEQRVLGIDGVASYASEERADVKTTDGRLHVAMDPLDGSSNLEPNSGMGTIFGIYSEQPPTVGTNLLAAGFVIYGPITSMVVARDGSVREYILEDGDKRVVDDDVTVPEDPTVFGFGGGVDSWTDEFESYAEAVRHELKLRYGGAMVADINQVLTYGGIFSYPALESRPEGKLRVQFEGHPMAYILESAGGRSSDGDQSLLEIEPDELHERTPLYLGNDDLIDRLEANID